MQRRAALDPQHLAQRQKLQMDEFTHVARIECDLLIFVGGKIDITPLSFEIIPARHRQRPLSQRPPNKPASRPAFCILHSTFCLTFRVALRWLEGGLRVALGWVEGGFGVAIPWLSGGFGVALLSHYVA